MIHFRQSLPTPSLNTPSSMILLNPQNQIEKSMENGFRRSLKIPLQKYKKCMIVKSKRTTNKIYEIVNKIRETLLIITLIVIMEVVTSQHKTIATNLSSIIFCGLVLQQADCHSFIPPICRCKIKRVGILTNNRVSSHLTVQFDNSV